MVLKYILYISLQLLCQLIRNLKIMTLWHKIRGCYPHIYGMITFLYYFLLYGHEAGLLTIRERTRIDGI